MTLNVMACRICADVLKFPVTERKFQFQVCGDCCHIEKVLANVGGLDIENDRTSFISRKIIAADSIEFELLKDGESVAVLNDNTLGEYFPAGTFTDQPLYSGFVVEWEKVLPIHGAGCYVVQLNSTILGNTTSEQSHHYQLYQFSEAIADGTVRLETYQNGEIEGSDFDFTGINWFSSIRIDGKLTNLTPKFTSDQTKDSTRRVIQIQDSILRQYTLETHLLPSTIANQIMFDGLLSNQIFVTDYNVHSYEVFTQLELYTNEITKAKFFDRNRNGAFEFKFDGKVQNIIKRNVK